MIRILLAEDQAMVRGALSALLGMENDLEVLAAAADGEAAWRELQRLKPDVLVTDIEMPGLSGLELAQRIQRHELPVKVIIVTTFARAGFLRRALDAGVLGYLLKESPAEHLAQAVRKVHAGGRAIDPELAVEAWSEADPLNDRERQVLRLAGEGVSASAIAAPAQPLARHRTQLSVRGHRQARRRQPHRSLSTRAAEGLAVGRN